MTVDGAIGRFRRRQADLFRDEATVSRPSGTGTLNPTTGDWVPDPATQVYAGPCLIRGQRWEASEVMVGGGEALLPHLQAKFPVGSGIQRNDVVVPSVSTYDPALVGKSFRVRDAHDDGWKITDWFIIEEVVE